MDLTITVLHEQNFQGQHCTECIGVTCNGHGTWWMGMPAMYCSQGFEGETCEKNMDDWTTVWE